MKRSIICTLILMILCITVQAQIGIFTKVIADSIFSKDYRFRSLPNYSLYNGITNIISPTTGTYDLTTPPGTTAQRPTVPASKYILRYNTDSAALEIGNPSQVWKTLSMSSVQTLDTSSISNFGLKVRSLFTATSPLQYNAVTGNLAIPQATSSQAGYLASADWVVFNAKLPDPGSNGLVARTALGTTAARQLVAGSTNISLVNANGVSGNPSIDVNDTLILSQIQLNHIPGVAPFADSTLVLNRTTGRLEVRPVASGGGSAINISNTSLTANGSYTQNWSENPWYVDSIGGSFLFRMGGIGTSGTRRKEFRINWGGSSFGDNLDGFNMLASVKKADLSGDSLTMGLQSSGTGVLSMGTFNVATPSSNNFISYNTAGLININAKDSIWIQGATPAATADSIFGSVHISGNRSKLVKFPTPTGGGVDEFSELLDVTITSPKNAQRPLYDSITGKWVNRLPAYFNVKDYGAVGDSITDDRAAIIKARDAAYTAGGVLFFPAGKYRISDSILFIHPIRIQGVGKSAGLRNQYSSLDKDRFGPVQASSEIIVTDGKNGFVFDRQPADSTKAAFVVEYLTITSTVAAGSTTGGAFIVVRGMIQGTIIRDNTFYGGYVQVDIQSGFYQLVTDNHFSAPKIAGLKVGNNIRTDTGDFTVTENVFSSGTFNTIDGTDSTKAIWWHSGGGMRVINNKFDVCEFDMTHAYVYSIYIANTLDPTSVIIISNNSIENWRKSAVYMRGIVAPYIRSIVISNNQFASVGSTGPAVDMDHMESIDISDNVMRDWNNGVAAPAIRVTNSIDVTIGKGEIRDYASSFDLTGSTNTHVDYMWGGDVAIGSKNTTNIAGLDTSLYTTETILGRETTGQFGSGVLELASKLADLPSGTPTDVGYITFVANSNVLADKRVAQIGATADGGATGGRGGILHFYTKPDGSSSLVERLRINSDGKFNFPSYSFGGTVATSLALSSTGDLIASTIIPQWAANGTHIYNNNSGNVGIGTATTPTTKLHIQFSSTGGDGLTIENTNSGVAARSMIKIINDQGLIGQFGSMSSTHATLPNFTLLEAIKDFQIGTDQGVASGGASVINFVTGGYSVAPAFIIKGTGVLNGSSLAGSGTRMVVADAIGDLSTQTIPASDGNGIYGGSGSLPSDVVVTGGSGEELDFNGSVDTDPFISIVNAGTGVGLFANGNLFGLDGQSTNVGVRAFGTEQGLLATGENSFGATIKSNSTIGLLVQSVPSSTNTVQEVVRFERGSSGGAGANGIGGSAAFYSKTTDNSSQMTNRFVSKFTTATTASRTSQFTLVGVNSASDNNILNIDGDGSFTTYGKRIVAVVTSSAGTLTIGNSESYIFNGTTTTWTLPAVSGTTGYKYYLKNIGSGSITLNADSGNNEIYSSSAVNTITITAGSSVVLISNGTYFTVN